MLRFTHSKFEDPALREQGRPISGIWLVHVPYGEQGHDPAGNLREQERQMCHVCRLVPKGTNEERCKGRAIG